MTTASLGCGVKPGCGHADNAAPGSAPVAAAARAKQNSGNGEFAGLADHCVGTMPHPVARVPVHPPSAPGRGLVLWSRLTTLCVLQCARHTPRHHTLAARAPEHAEHTSSVARGGHRTSSAMIMTRHMVLQHARACQSVFRSHARARACTGRGQHMRTALQRGARDHVMRSRPRGHWPCIWHGRWAYRVDRM